MFNTLLDAGRGASSESGRVQGLRTFYRPRGPREIPQRHDAIMIVEAPARRVIHAVKKQGMLERRHRPVHYLNNEQDHRSIKRRFNAKHAFREFHAARRTIHGYEAINMMRKGQTLCVKGRDVRCQIRFIWKAVQTRRLTNQNSPAALTAFFADFEICTYVAIGPERRISPPLRGTETAKVALRGKPKS
jgi:DDE domain